MSFALTSKSASETQIPTIEAAFEEFTSRKDVAILLINQHVRLFDCLSAADRQWCWNTLSGRREDQAHGRQISGGIPSSARDSVQGPSIRSVTKAS